MILDVKPPEQIMSKPPEQGKRSPTRTLVLVVLSVCFPSLGAILGGFELGAGNYRFGTGLILLALAWSVVVLVLLHLTAPSSARGLKGL
jgi:hypothetical protein